MESGGATTPEARAARQAAEQKLQDDIRAALGPDNYAAFQRANDQDYKTLTSVAKRLSLPETTADTVYATRDTYAAQSQQISQNPALTPAERRDQLSHLATQAKTALTATLGSEGAEAYAQRAQWLNMLKNGNAFSMNPKDAPAGYSNPGSTVYPVRPPRVVKPVVPPKT